MSADDLIAGGPDAEPADDDASPFLGVPDDYRAFRKGSAWGPRTIPMGFGGQIDRGRFGVDVDRMVGPRYRKGDEFIPSTFSEEDRANLQLAMRAAGLFGPKQRFQLGVWDETTRNAYKKLLVYANGAGLEWNEALREYASAREQFGEGGVGGVGDEDLREPLVKRITNPTDIRAVADAVAPGAIGRRLQQDELEKIIAAYQALESEQQEQLYNSDVTGGTVVDPPALDSFVTQEAQRRDPYGALEMDVLPQLGEFGQLLRDTGGI